MTKLSAPTHPENFLYNTSLVICQILSMDVSFLQKVCRETMLLGMPESSLHAANLPSV